MNRAASRRARAECFVTDPLSVAAAVKWTTHESAWREFLVIPSGSDFSFPTQVFRSLQRLHSRFITKVIPCSSQLRCNFLNTPSLGKESSLIQLAESARCGDSRSRLGLRWLQGATRTQFLRRHKPSF